MTTWNAARDAIATVLAGVSISAPVTAQIKKVHKYRDVAETDFPCVVMPNPPGKVVSRGPSGYRNKLYNVLIQVLVRDADKDREAELLDAFEEAIIDAFDNAVTLGLFSGYSVVEGPNWDAAGIVQISDSVAAAGANGTLVIKMLDGKNFIG
jgi:hypothetical protein